MQDIDISVATSGHGLIIVGDFEGSIYFIDRKLNVENLQAYEIAVSHLFQLRQHNLLVSIGVCIICDYKNYFCNI